MRGHRDPRPYPTRLPGPVGTGGGNDRTAERASARLVAACNGAERTQFLLKLIGQRNVFFLFCAHITL